MPAGRRTNGATTGCRQREKKRRTKAAMAAGQARSRTSGSSASKWWRTLLRSTACCARCGLVIREGGEAIYRHVPREIRCVSCGGMLEDSKGWRPSVAWERRRGARQQGAFAR